MSKFEPTYKDIESNIGTPAYIFDIDVLNSRIDAMKQILGKDIELCYAMKANPFVVKGIKEKIDKYEVCSHGEFKICEKAELDMKKIVLSGVYKEEKDTERIVKKYRDDILYTCESVRQFELIRDLSEKIETELDVILRITTGNQFGIDEVELCEIIKNRKENKYINIIGIQHFSGTQRKNLKNYREELSYCKELIEKLESEYGFENKVLEFGTGFFFDYFQPKERNQEISYEILRAEEIKLLTDFRALLDEFNFPFKITLEIGRFIVASCGKYYTKIVDLKLNNDIRFAIVDGGIHQLNYFGQMMGMKLPWYRQLKENGDILTDGEEKTNVCGSLCTINDNLVKGMPLTKPSICDILEFRNTGAYSMTETPALFLSRDFPKVYLYENEKLNLVRDRKEAFELNF